MLRTALEFPPEAVAVVERLAAAGRDSCFVGGSVRDALLGHRPDDVDIVTAATPDELREIFPEAELVGASFGVSLVRSGGYSFEVATAREERCYLDGRHPESIRYTRDLACDVARRDFTVNALLYDPLRGELRDEVGGVEDLRREVLRTVGDPEVRFREDYLRMFRLVRFAARLRFSIEAATWAALVRLAPLAEALAVERVAGECDRMFGDRNRLRAVELLKSSGLMRVVLPEVDRLEGVEQPAEFHPEGDVWRHTFLAIGHLACAEPDLVWSVLLHDVGKAAARRLERDGKIHFYGHECVGAELADAILARLRFPLERRRTIVRAVRNHMRLAQAESVRSGKLVRWCGEKDFALELELHRADCMSCHGLAGAWKFILDRLAERPEMRELPEPFLTGNDLIAAGFKPGPAFKKMLEQWFERQLSGEITSRTQALNALQNPKPHSKCRL